MITFTEKGRFWYSVLTLLLLPCRSGCFSSVPFRLSNVKQSRVCHGEPLNTAVFASPNSLVVVSPPGGVGEVAAVKAAMMGAKVKWFVVSRPNDDDDDGVAGQEPIVLSQLALSEISAAGGIVELAGSTASSLLISKDDPNSALPAVSTWCGAADGLVCSYDGVEPPKKRKRERDDQDTQLTWKDAIKVAAREAAKSIVGNKVAILAADESVVPTDENKESNAGLGRFVTDLLGGGRVDIPDRLSDAMESGDRPGTVLILRYGQLFGTPESSPDFSPLVGGPKKAFELCEEYLMRGVRVDPTLSVSGNVMLSGSTTRSCRHAVGEAAARMALGKVPVQSGLDVSLASQRGNDPITDASWEAEFSRVRELSSAGPSALLFSSEFGSVPDVPRLADWLATKWAPAVLRLYDIAAIRVGARPVSILQPDEDSVEIIWQQLVNFESVVVGKMTIQVSQKNLLAFRGPGDAQKGFGEISRIPLAGEDILVRRLAEAASQAIEKGLANKPIQKRSEEVMAPTPVIAEKPVVTSLKSSGTVVAEPESPSSTTGPRQAGVRRSQERTRGKRQTNTDNN